MDVGFIGLGRMGGGVAANLLKAGHRVSVWNRTRAPVEALVALGARAVDQAHDALQGPVAFSMLADDSATRAVLIDSGALERAAPGLVHASLATISTALAVELAARHRTLGLAYVSAPVFGRPDAAAAAKLNIVAAGPEPALDTLQPLFDAIGQKTWRLGADAVQANAVKIAGNFMIASAIEAMAEASALGESYGVATAEFLEILTSTLFAAPVYRNYGGLIAEQRYEPAGFKLRLGLKDVRLALAAGDERQVPLPFASVLRDALLEAMAHGDGDRDWAALAAVARRRAGTSDS